MLTRCLHGAGFNECLRDLIYIVIVLNCVYVYDERLPSLNEYTISTYISIIMMCVT